MKTCSLREVLIESIFYEMKVPSLLNGQMTGEAWKKTWCSQNSFQPFFSGRLKILGNKNGF